MKNGRPQCKDIPTRPILELLAKNPEKWHGWDEEHSQFPVQLAFPPDTPPKLVLGKMRSLIQKGLVNGCACRCRGDFTITTKGLHVLNNKPELFIQTTEPLPANFILTEGLHELQ